MYIVPVLFYKTFDTPSVQVIAINAHNQSSVLPELLTQLWLLPL